MADKWSEVFIKVIDGEAEHMFLKNVIIIRLSCTERMEFKLRWKYMENKFIPEQLHLKRAMKAQKLNIQTSLNV